METIMTMKNNQILKGIIFNSFLLIALADGNACERNKEDFDKHDGYYLSPQYKAIEDVKDQKYNLIGVALFSGKDPVSTAIKRLTHSNVSHVGIILSDAKDENKWYCFESTGSASEVLKGQYPHVRVTSWNSVVNDYDGKISYRLAVFEDKDRTDSNSVTKFVDGNDRKSYTKNPLKLIKALFRKNKDSQSKISNTFFCSELTAKMLMDLNILKEDIPSNYLPKDFSSKSRIPLTSGIWLTPEFRIER